METFKKVNDRKISDTSTLKSTHPLSILPYNGNQKSVLRASDSIKKVCG